MSASPHRLLPDGQQCSTDRLSADDMATQREAEFLADALLAQQLKAAGGMSVLPGVCTYCRQRCMARTVYCDADCRADHEAELRTLARQGRAR
jgi:hypothetical protein